MSNVQPSHTVKRLRAPPPKSIITHSLTHIHTNKFFFFFFILNIKMQALCTQQTDFRGEISLD